VRTSTSATSRAKLPRHLREPFKLELTDRLLARHGERVSVEDIRAIAEAILRRMRSVQ
jgi:hypothetical protein